MAGLFDKQLIYVTGKGGVGKTTVAAALGLACAEAGRRTIVCEVAEQDRFSRAFARAGTGAGEVELADGLFALSLDPQAALEEWVTKQLGGVAGGAATRTLLRSAAFQYFVAAAPGAKELITIAKVWELAQAERWNSKNRTYDTVVVDAPASGHGLAMLRTPQTYGDIARVGPINRQATKVSSLLRDQERTAYVAVALPEEMPVTETVELEGKLPDAVGTGLSAIVVNGVLPERFSAEEAERLQHLADADADGRGDVASGPLRAALDEHARARGQREHLARLEAEAVAPVVTLPFLAVPDVGLDEYRELAAELAERLGALSVA